MLSKKKQVSKKFLILDMDGTLYQFKEGSFKKSKLQKEILKRAQQFLVKELSMDNNIAKKKISEIINKYGENISIGFEKEYKINRLKYFNYTWNIPAKKFIKKQTVIKKLIIGWKKNFNIILLSDSPKLWIKNVLKELELYNILKSDIFSGEGNYRKIFKNVFPEIIKKYNSRAENFIVVGDQEETDIIPAKKNGMTTVFISRKEVLKSADFNIKNIFELDRILKQYSSFTNKRG